MGTNWNAAHTHWETTARGWDVLHDQRINKGTAFPADERRELGLIGQLPPQVLTLGDQAARAYEQYCGQPSDLDKNVYLTALRDRNQVLFYHLLGTHLQEMLPVVYTPVVAQAIERYSHVYRRPRGVFLSVNEMGAVEESLRNSGLGPDEVDLIVATDGEGILGIGDWGLGGMDIAIGKLAVYTAAAGINPARVLPVMLDVGTNQLRLLGDPAYLGNQHPRVPPERYDEFMDVFVEAVRRVFPHALLHWEDLGVANGRRLLQRYQDRIATFNDDMQGTGATTLAAVLAGVRATGIPMREQRVVVFGAGTAGVGIADQLRDAIAADGRTVAEATAQVYCIDRHGLITDHMSDLMDFQRPYARPAAEVADWAHDQTLGGVPLAEVLRRVHPTILLGTSTRAGAFTEELIRELASVVKRPIILPMSNPTALMEARPADLIHWTEGRALVASGSPFPPVTYDRRTYVIGQANNALIFPGLGLGAIVGRASRVTDRMLRAAAAAVAGLVDAEVSGALLPHFDDLRGTSAAVASAVIRAAQADGVAQADLGRDVDAAVRAAMWWPRYAPVRAV